MAPHEPGSPRGGRRPGAPRLSAEQAVALGTLARASGPREAVLVLAMLELGLRTSEILAAEIGDLARQGSFTVLAVRGKGQAAKARRIPLSAALVDAFTQAVGDRDSGALLADRSGRRMTRQQAVEAIRRLGEQLGIERLEPTHLRNAFVSRNQDAFTGAGAREEPGAPTSLHRRSSSASGRADGAPLRAEPPIAF